MRIHSCRMPFPPPTAALRNQTRRNSLFTSEKAVDLNYNMCFSSNNNLSESGFCICDVRGLLPGLKICCLQLSLNNGAGSRDKQQGERATAHWSPSSTTPMTLRMYCLYRSYFWEYIIFPSKAELQESRRTILFNCASPKAASTILST